MQGKASALPDAALKGCPTKDLMRLYQLDEDPEINSG
jgi:hypothetical protein